MSPRDNLGFLLTPEAAREQKRVREESIARETAGLTAQQYAIQQYNLMVADMSEFLTAQEIESCVGQAVIRYFMVRLKMRFEKDYLAETEKAVSL